jgi:hypothetical protein
MFEENLHAKTDAAGRLRLDIATQYKNAEVQVSLQIAEPMTREEYLAFVGRTFGSIDDPTFVRPPQNAVRPPVKLD